ncbi:MAG: LysR family transcriptional regulator [Porticoccaceae bacterium]
MLETLDAIDRRGSYAKAAEELNKATSAISYIVQKLEEQLDIALFQRQGRRSVLTPAGQLVLEEGRKILNASVKLANAAKEIATGWEPQIRIAVDSMQSYPAFFETLASFLKEHRNVEVDVCESVLNGGWEALEHGRVELVVGAPGPVPAQKGYRSISLGHADLVPVIAAHHEQAHLAHDHQALSSVFPLFRRVVTHDTSTMNIARSEGWGNSGKRFYVQNIHQKAEAIIAGIGIGHLPRQLAQQYINSGSLVELSIREVNNHENYLAWKISNKGKGMAALTKLLAAVNWQSGINAD